MELSKSVFIQTSKQSCWFYLTLRQDDHIDPVLLGKSSDQFGERFAIDIPEQKSGH